MLESFFQTSSVGMTKEAYFEMCEALGSEPEESEIPVEMDDFPDVVQETIRIYNKLRDDWDSMNGTYLGKSMVGIKDMLDIWCIPIEDRKLLLDWVTVIDRVRSNTYSSMKPTKDSTESAD